MPADRPLLLWFRNDLRLLDNPALSAAIETGKPLVACYCFDENLGGAWKIGSASRWWLHHSLSSLSKSLKELGIQLVLRKGKSDAEIEKLVDELDAESIYFARSYSPNEIKLESKIHERLSRDGLEVKRFAGYLLQEPENIKTLNGEPFKVFTAFWKKLQRQPEKYPLAPIKFKQKISKKCDSDKLDDWNLLPTSPDWSTGFSEWQPGENGALAKMDSFLSHTISRYEDERDFPDIEASSRLSPHLHFGEISPRYLYSQCRRLSENFMESSGNVSSIEAFMRQIVWREFCYHLLFHWPDLANSAFREKFDHFPWKRNAKRLRRWQQGETGYPIIDAGMKQLWQSGWMHNRVRMLVASFLTKNLLIHWHDGERWFWDTLLDADLANNAAGWQWVSGSGADAAPYFRIFNPVTQSQKFDPKGHYIRRWLPQLSALPDKYIHDPSAAPGEVLSEAGVEIGVNYPAAMVDLKESRQQALAAYQDLKVLSNGD